MLGVIPPSSSRLIALVAAVGCCSATGLLGMPSLLAAVLGLAWVAVGWSVLGPFGLAAALPALALLPGGGWVALAGWSLAGAAGAVAASALVAERQRSLIRQLKDELRDAEHERQLLSRSIRRWPVLLDACLDLSSAKELDQFAQVLCQHARALQGDAREIQVFLGRGSAISCRAGQDATGADHRREPGPDELFCAAEARPLTRREGQSLRVLLPLRGDRRRDGEGASEPLRGVLAVELVISDVGERMGIELLGALARLGGLGLAAVDLVDQARSLALHDDLTGLFGRHEFLRRLAEQAANAQRSHRQLSLVMCDLDHLKRFNDRWGHAAGDAALRVVAEAIRASLPEGAIACRAGGEEFALLLPGLDLPAALARAERLRAAIANASCGPAGEDRRVTASIGVALLAEGEDPTACLARADAACYRAKSLGRDRVVEAPPPATTLPATDPVLRRSSGRLTSLPLPPGEGR